MARNNSRSAAKSGETARRRARANLAERAERAFQKEPSARSCVIYARVSSKDQEKEGFSIPAQLRLLQDYAATQGMTVAEEFIDVETAKKAGRTNFNEMLAFLKVAGSRCRTVLVEKTDRLYRNISDWVTIDALGLEIHLVKEGTVLSEDSRSSEKFIHGIKVLMAKNYVDNLSEESRKGMKEKADQGIWPGIAPLGYRNVRREDGKNVIEVDPERGPLMVRLFEAYLSGDVSLSGLRRFAAKIGLTTKKGTTINRSSLHVLLQNPVFCGDIVWKGVTTRGIHQPLISRETFDQVQDLLADRALVSRATQFREFTFSGLVHCSWCHSEEKTYLLVGEIHKGTYIYYTCQECKRLGRAVYHRERDMEAQFLRALKRMWVDADVLQMLRDALKESHAEIAGLRDRAVGDLQRQMQQLQGRLDRAYDDRLDGRLSAEDYDRRAGAWRDQIARLSRDIEAHGRADHLTVDQSLEIVAFASTVLAVWDRQPPEERRKLLHLLCSNFLFGEEGLTINWLEPFDELAELADERENKIGQELALLADRPIWLPLLDSNQRPPD
jgi:site-specific DNA recombinase